MGAEAICFPREGPALNRLLNDQSTIPTAALHIALVCHSCVGLRGNMCKSTRHSSIRPPVTSVSIHHKDSDKDKDYMY